MVTCIGNIHSEENYGESRQIYRRNSIRVLKTGLLLPSIILKLVLPFTFGLHNSLARLWGSLRLRWTNLCLSNRRKNEFGNSSLSARTPLHNLAEVHSATQCLPCGRALLELLSRLPSVRQLAAICACALLAPRAKTALRMLSLPPYSPPHHHYRQFVNRTDPQASTLARRQRWNPTREHWTIRITYLFVVQFWIFF